MWCVPPLKSPYQSHDVVGMRIHQQTHNSVHLIQNQCHPLISVMRFVGKVPTANRIQNNLNCVPLMVIGGKCWQWKISLFLLLASEMIEMTVADWHLCPFSMALEESNQWKSLIAELERAACNNKPVQSSQYLTTDQSWCSVCT